MTGQQQHIIVMNDCECGRHKLEPRYDSHRVGDVFQKIYVCDVCVICGHGVPRMLSVAERLDRGLMTKRQAEEWLNVQLQANLEAFGGERLPTWPDSK